METFYSTMGCNWITIGKYKVDEATLIIRPALVFKQIPKLVLIEVKNTDSEERSIGN